MIAINRWFSAWLSVPVCDKLWIWSQIPILWSNMNIKYICFMKTEYSYSNKKYLKIWTSWGSESWAKLSTGLAEIVDWYCLVVQFDWVDLVYFVCKLHIENQPWASYDEDLNIWIWKTTSTYFQFFFQYFF